MKKQFLPILAASLMLGGASQINAMESLNIPSNRGPIWTYRRAIVDRVMQRSEPPYQINNIYPEIQVAYDAVVHQLTVRHSFIGGDRPEQPIQQKIIHTEPCLQPDDVEDVRAYAQRVEARKNQLLQQYAYLLLAVSSRSEKDDANVVSEISISPSPIWYEKYIPIYRIPSSDYNERRLNVIYKNWWIRSQSSWLPSLTMAIEQHVVTSVPFPKVKEGESFQVYQQRLNDRAQLLLKKYSQYMKCDFKPISFISNLIENGEPYEEIRIRTRCCLTKLDLNKNKFTNGIVVCLERGTNLYDPWDVQRQAQELVSFAIPKKEDAESSEQYNLRVREQALSKTKECILTHFPNGLNDIRSIITDDGRNFETFFKLITQQQ